MLKKEKQFNSQNLEKTKANELLLIKLQQQVRLIEDLVGDDELEMCPIDSFIRKYKRA